jgi:hypothetical protein
MDIRVVDDFDIRAGMGSVLFCAMDIHARRNKNSKS